MTSASAHLVIAPVLGELIREVRKASERVVASGASAGGKGSLDEEAVHDFRVALRRLRTLLRVARRVYGKRRMRAIAEDLKRFADTTGTLRDEEVLRTTLTDLKLPVETAAALSAWMPRRARMERQHRIAIIKLLRDKAGAPEDRLTTGPQADSPGPLRGHGGSSPSRLLEQSLARLERRLARGPSHARCQAAGDVARDAIASAMKGVREAACARPDDIAAMHALRIRFKRLRYTVELFESLLGTAGPELARSAARMQRRLGHVHDLDEATVRMGRAWGLAENHRAVVIAALREARKLAAEKAKRDLETELGAIDLALSRT